MSLDFDDNNMRFRIEFASHRSDLALDMSGRFTAYGRALAEFRIHLLRGPPVLKTARWHQGKREICKHEHAEQEHEPKGIRVRFESSQLDYAEGCTGSRLSF